MRALCRVPGSSQPCALAGGPHKSSLVYVMLLAAALLVYRPACSPHLACGDVLFLVVHWMSISLQCMTLVVHWRAWHDDMTRHQLAWQSVSPFMKNGLRKNKCESPHCPLVSMSSDIRLPSSSFVGVILGFWCTSICCGQEPGFDTDC